MSTHADILIEDAEFFLTEYGEEVVVHPPAGDARTVMAIVERTAPDLQDRPRTELGPVVVRLRNDASAGIAAAEISTRWPEQDPGFMTVELT